MLKIVTGPSFADLERGLIEEVRRIKTTDPLFSLAIVVPSYPLLAYVRRRLVVDAGLSLLNVHFLTFYQLALRLADERVSSGFPPEPDDRLEIVSDFFCEHLLARIVKKLPGLDPLTRAALPVGASAALWATVRDLKDAAVEPAIALRATGEGLFESDDQPALQALFTLHAAALEAGRALSAGTPDDLTASMISWASRSQFLARLQGVCYYGFYDLTQIQLSFFEAVTARTAATLYFPCGDGASFGFARRFLERHLAGITTSIEPMPATEASPGGSLRESPAVSATSMVGPEDELATVCKEILDLVETRGYGFQEIGVTARSLVAYQPILRRIFEQHRIPLICTAGAPAPHDPLVKTLLQLAWLPVLGFTVRAVLDLICSPFYRVQEHGRADAARPDLWKLIVADLGITGQEEDWKRLTAGSGFQDGEDGPLNDQRRLLERQATGLIRNCRALPAEGSMGSLTDAFIALAERHLILPDHETGAADAEDQAGAIPASVMAAVMTAWEQLRQLDRLGLDLTWEEWAKIFTNMMERTTVSLAAGAHEGVTVLDAMAARGLSFRALFIIGLNEKVFPRVIREDAFLRDRHRRVLAETLGYKIDEKLSGYDEEQLLFTLLCRSVRERLYLSYQRADEDGRVLAPSLYMEEARGSLPVFHVPRRFSERVGRPPFLPALLTRREWALYQASEGADISAFLAATGGEAELFRNSAQALRGIESEEAGPFDGLTGPLDRYWDKLVAKGITPTSLEQYARCPFQYFSSQVLRLEPVRMTLSGDLPAQALGELCHATLNLSYRLLLKAGWPGGETDPDATRALIRSAAAEAFDAYAARYGTGYPLLWDLARDRVTDLVVALVEEDRRSCLDSGFRPVAFEVEAEGKLQGLGIKGLESVKVIGRLDRVDRRQVPPGWRILDYKFKQSRKMKGEERNLLAAAVHGIHLQPPLYTMMKPKPSGELASSADQSGPEKVEFFFLAPAWEQVVDRSAFEASAWQGPAGSQIKRTIIRLLTGIRAGQYVMLPDNTYCDYCDFSAACRRFHGQSEWRTYRTTPAKELRLLRKQKLEKAGDDRA